MNDSIILQTFKDSRLVRPKPRLCLCTLHLLFVAGPLLKAFLFVLQVTVENFLRVLTGRLPPSTPRSKRLLSDDHSNILIYLTGQPGNSLITGFFISSLFWICGSPFSQVTVETASWSSRTLRRSATWSWLMPLSRCGKRGGDYRKSCSQHAVTLAYLTWFNQ